MIYITRWITILNLPNHKLCTQTKVTRWNLTLIHIYVAMKFRKLMVFIPFLINKKNDSINISYTWWAMMCVYWETVVTKLVTHSTAWGAYRTYNALGSVYVWWSWRVTKQSPLIECQAFVRLIIKAPSERVHVSLARQRGRPPQQHKKLEKMSTLTTNRWEIINSVL